MPYTWPVTVAEVKTEINETSSADDAELQGFIDAATETVENIVGPVASTPYTDWIDGGSQVIILERYPIVSVDTVTEYTGTTPQTIVAEPFGSTTYTDLGYRVDTETGILTRTSGGTVVTWAPGSRNVRVDYHAGRATVPAGLRMAALEFVRRWWGASQGSGSVTYPVNMDEEFTVDGVAYSIRTLLAPYRKAPHV